MNHNTSPDRGKRHVMLIDDINSAFSLDKMKRFTKSPLEDPLLRLCRVSHPRTGSKVVFGFTQDRILEIQRCKTDYSSWFINSSVVKDGSMIMATKIDPLFLLLPTLRQQASHFCSIDQLLESSDVYWWLKTNNNMESLDLSVVCDTHGNAYRYSEQRTLQWLRQKMERVKSILQKQKNLDDESRNCIISQNEEKGLIVESFQIIGDYLESQVLSALCSHYSILPEEVYRQIKRKNEIQNDHDISRFIKQSEYDIEVKNKKAKNASTASQKKLAQVNTKGMKSMTSFFTKKT